MSQRTSEVARARALYSDSVEDLETMCYFFANQEKRLLPRNTQYLPIDLRSSGSKPQSASE